MSFEEFKDLNFEEILNANLNNANLQVLWKKFIEIFYTFHVVLYSEMDATSCLQKCA
jgi:hypothetical protein